MPFPNVELPADFDVRRINEKPSRDRQMANLRFGPGISGRAKGNRNKICRDLREGLIEGAVLHGYSGNGEGGLIGYCFHLAQHHPKIYAGLLAKLLPYNLHANVGGHIGQVNILSVPSGQQLSAANLARVERGEITIDEALAHAKPYEEPAIEPEPIEAPAPVQEIEEPAAPEETALLAKMAALSVEEITRLLDAIKNEPASSVSGPAVRYERATLRLPSQPIPPVRTQRPYRY